jgi:acyl-CoA synthetase (AMP-forming)/AMP-acid ligase II
MAAQAHPDAAALLYETDPADPVAPSSSISYSQLLAASRAVAATLRAAAGEVKARTRNQQIADDGASQVGRCRLTSA